MVTVHDLALLREFLHPDRGALSDKQVSNVLGWCCDLPEPEPCEE